MAPRRVPPLLLILTLACNEGEGAHKSDSAPAEEAPAQGTKPDPPAPLAKTPPPPEPAEPEGPPQADPSRLKVDGNIVQGGLVFGTVEPGTKVRVRRKKVRVSKQGDFLVAFGRNAKSPVKMSVTFPDGAVLEHLFEVEDRKFEPEKIDGLPEEMVDLDKPTQKRLRKYNRRIEKIRKKYRDASHYKDGFAWPCKGRITSGYGQRRILNGEKRGYHWGVDVAAPVGRKVRAPVGGVVVFAEPDVPLSGHTVIVDHGHGLSSSFLHLSKISVKVGDEVKKGQVLGKVGKTGRATGPHLDWRMNLLDKRIDPELLVPNRREPVASAK